MKGFRISHAAAGRADAADAIDSFLSAWKYGCGLLEGELRTLGTWLRQCAVAYKQTDDQLAQAAGGHK